MKMTMEWTKTQTCVGWSRTVRVHLSKMTVKRQRHQWQQKERLRKKKNLQCLVTHELASTTLTDFPSVSGHFTRCWDFRSALHNVKSIIAVVIYSIFDLYSNFFVDSHTAKMSFLIWFLYSSPSVAVVRRHEIEINQKQIRESRAFEVLSKYGTQRGSPFYHIALHASSFNDFLWIIMNSFKKHSIATNWRKNSMIGAIFHTSRMTLTWVVVPQISGLDCLMWTSYRWSQKDFSMIQCFQTYHWAVSVRRSTTGQWRSR